jgi:hypothetical protein
MISSGEKLRAIELVSKILFLLVGSISRFIDFRVEPDLMDHPALALDDPTVVWELQYLVFEQSF